jgi:hypothetical protein
MHIVISYIAIVHEKQWPETNQKTERQVMSPTNDDLIAVGYYIILPTPRQAFMSDTLLPNYIRSVSNCICPKAPDDWALDWASGYTSEERVEQAQRFGISKDRVQGVIAFATDEFERQTGYPNVFYALPYARAFYEEFVQNGEAEIIGLGIHASDYDALFEELTPSEGQGEHGIYHVAAQKQPLAPNGEALGYEIVNFDAFLCCSWLCNGLEIAVSEKWGTRPNQLGLLDDRLAAQQAAEYCGSDEAKAEPGLWLACQLVRYPTKK